MATDIKTIPTIDISSLLANPRNIDAHNPVINKLHEACKAGGFFYIKGHGVPSSLFNGVRESARQFFNNPIEEKIKSRLSPDTGFRGYTKLLENASQGKCELQESIDSYREFTPGSYGPLSKYFEGPNLWPENPPKMKSMMKEYINSLEDLSRIVMRGIALAVGGSPDTFEGDRAGESFWLLRTLGYPGTPDENNPDAIGIRPHVDYGLLNLVNQDNGVNALEVLDQSGEWISVPPIPGTLVCSTGEMLKIWTNGLYDCAVHRVINNSSKYRISVVFLYEPNFDAVVEPLQLYKEITGSDAQLEKVSYANYLINKVGKNFTSEVLQNSKKQVMQTI